MKSDRPNAWTSAKLRECHNEVEQEDEERKSIVQQILQKSTDFLGRILVPVEGRGGGHTVLRVPSQPSVSA